MEFKDSGFEGIRIREGKRGDVYYGTYRSKITGQSTKIRLGFVKDFKKPRDAHDLKVKLIEQEYQEHLRKEQNRPIAGEKYNNRLCLNDIKESYFVDRQEKVLSQLRSEYNHLSDSDFEKLTIRIKKIETVNKDRRLYEKYIEPYKVATLPLEDVTREITTDYQRTLNQTRLSEKSKYNILSPLRACFNYGIRENLIKIDNPFAPKLLSFDKVLKKRERALTNKEVESLLVECKKYNHEQIRVITDKNGRKRTITIPINYNIYLAVYLGQLTAARKTTVLSIRKRDINVKTREIILRNFKVRNRVYKQVLPQEAIDWLVNKVFPYYDNEEYLIRPMNPNKRTGQAMKDLPKKLYEIMDDMFNQGLTDEDRLKKITFHNIRHSVATNLLEETNIHFVMKKLDHSSIIQTQNYLDLKDEELTRATEEQSKKVFGFAKKNQQEPQTVKTDEELTKEDLIEELLKIEESAFLKKYYPSRTKEELEELYFKKLIAQ